ncbi:hypothetical protein ABZ569_32325 [Streptomyces albus]|uniref:hypothetical protein n=1 Tax=Streptomyces albus TaxID=1888 RepID=UPI0034107A0A
MSRRLVAAGRITGRARLPKTDVPGPRLVAAGRLTGRRCGFDIDPETLARHPAIASKEEAHRLGECARLYAEQQERRREALTAPDTPAQTPEVTA